MNDIPECPGSAPFRAILLIPVYNHGATLRNVVEDGLRQGHPVLVVDDGSTDGSLDSVMDLPILRHRLPENRGKGAAIQAGAALAAAHGYDAVITLDADGQHDPADAQSLLDVAAPIWPAIVLGERRQAQNRSSASLFGMAFSNFWVRLECGQTLSDTQSGFRVYPVRLLLQRFLSRRYTFEIEVLVRGAWAGLPIVSSPVSVYYPPKEERISHFRMFRDNLRLTGLHAWLVARSLLPLPHRCLFPSHPGENPSSSLWHPVRFFRELSREHTTPGELATAAWIGIFVGSLPITPFGIVTILYLCHRFHLNKIAGAGASNICVMPFVPFLCIQVGHLLWFGHWWTVFNRHTLLDEIHLRLWEWFLGSLIVGPVLGILGAMLTFSLVRTIRARST